MEQYSRLSFNVIADLVGKLAAAKYWGVLRVKDSGAWKEYDFASGGVRVTSLGDRRAPMLGQICARRFHVAPARIDELVESQHESREPIGELMVRAHLVTEEDRDSAVKEQVVAELADLYTWEGARYTFIPGQQRPKNPEFEARRQEEGHKPVTYSGNLGDLLTRAKKAYYEFENLKKDVGSGDSVYAFTTAAREKLYKQGGFQRLVDADQRVVVLLDGKRSLSEIIAKVPYGMVETLRIIQKLKKAGALTKVR